MTNARYYSHDQYCDMKHYFLFFIFFAASLSIAFSQETNAKTLYATAKDFMRQGDYENATLVLSNALKQEPTNIDMLKDMAFLSYLKRDFAKAIEIGKGLIERNDVDEQSFQILGMAYKSIAETKECDKLYKKGLKKFPNSGVLYNEYGELLATQKNMSAAIEQWEKGIETSPSFSSNYFNAANYYAEKDNFFQEIIYGEIFLNLESYSTRSADMKGLLLEGYKKLYTNDYLNKLLNDKTTGPFAKAFFETILKSNALASEGISAESLTAIRARFILDWYGNKNNEKFPFHLFDRQQYLLREGMFEAYNEWIFGTAANPSAYQLWITANDAKASAFKKFQQSRVFKIPLGQYYH